MILDATIQLLKKTLNKVDITVLSHNPQIDVDRCTVRVLESMARSWRSLPRTGCLLTRCLLWVLLWKCFHLNSHRLLDEKLLQEYANADAVIVRGADTLTQYYGFLSLASHLACILPAVLMKKPVLLLGHTLGPFGNLEEMAKAILNRVDVIILREGLSEGHMRLAGILNPRVHVTVDLSINLDDPNPANVKIVREKEGISGDVKWIGVSVIQSASRFFGHGKGSTNVEEGYVELMAEMIDYMIERLDANVLIVPFNLGPGHWDDRIISRSVYSRTAHQDRIRLLTKEYRSEELAGIIGCCEMFVGARMHACVTALMNCVPTIALSYGHKFYGVIGGTWGGEKYILNLKDLEWASLREKIDETWNSRSQVAEDLRRRKKIVQQKAQQNYIILREFLESLGTADDSSYESFSLFK